MGKWKVEGEGAQTSGNTFEVEIRLRFGKCGRRLLNNLKHKTCRQRQRQPHDKMPTIKCNSFFKPTSRAGGKGRERGRGRGSWITVMCIFASVCVCVCVWVAFYDNANLSEEDVDTFFSRWQRAVPPADKMRPLRQSNDAQWWAAHVCTSVRVCVCVCVRLTSIWLALLVLVLLLLLLVQNTNTTLTQMQSRAKSLPSEPWPRPTRRVCRRRRHRHRQRHRCRRRRHCCRRQSIRQAELMPGNVDTDTLVACRLQAASYQGLKRPSLAMSWWDTSPI